MPNRDEKTSEIAPPFVLDITEEVCPLTFVRTKLLVERMAPGDVADVLLRGAEPLTNVPRAVQSLGHQLLEMAPVSVSGANTGDVHRMRFRKRQSNTPLKDRDP